MKVTEPNVDNSKTNMPATNWHGDEYYFGMHYDLHASEEETELGARVDNKTLIPMLKLMQPDWIQTDCKGHAGYTSWFSEAEHATISPGIVHDALLGWRNATLKLGIKLHCHYSGVWDAAAGRKHPEWCMVDKNGHPLDGSDTGQPTEDNVSVRQGIMSFHGDYQSQLMLPQFYELIDRYQVDGFWIDGEIWATHADYSDASKTAFLQKTGINHIPESPDDPDWFAWMQFNRDSFHAYVTRYTEAVHAHKEEVLVCSNWLQTFRHPGEPKVPTDWISGDNHWVFSLDASRCEARFISTRKKRWDIMLWSFYKTGSLYDQTLPWSEKPVEMLQQEAAVTLALGGSVQIYLSGGNVRNGQLAHWRMARTGQVGEFVKKRRDICQHTKTIPQVAILHSEHHYYADATVPFPFWEHNAQPVEGATTALLECHFGVDVLDEWALLDAIETFPIVVVPERHNLSDAMVDSLKTYVENGGTLLLTGAKSFVRFGAQFIGATVAKTAENQTYYFPSGDGMIPIYSENWVMLKPTTAHAYRNIALSTLTDDRLTDFPCAVVNTFGKGRVIFIPTDFFAFFHRARYAMLRNFIKDMLNSIISPLPIRMTAPTGVDMVLRQKDTQTIIHLLNLTSGLPNSPRAGEIDEIPPLGAIHLEVDLPQTPERVELAFEEYSMSWNYADGVLFIDVAAVHIHSAIVID
ncbi:MAG: alpha-L-fucosidase [Aggregatilineales bacterium]